MLRAGRVDEHAACAAGVPGRPQGAGKQEPTAAGRCELPCPGRAPALFSRHPPWMAGARAQLQAATDQTAVLKRKLAEMEAGEQHLQVLRLTAPCIPCAELPLGSDFPNAEAIAARYFAHALLLGPCTPNPNPPDVYVKDAVTFLQTGKWTRGSSVFAVNECNFSRYRHLV